MGQYLMDSNVISHFLSNKLSATGMKFIAEIIDETPNISVITQIEALSWVNKDKAKEKIIKDFIKDARIIQLTPDVIATCVKLRRGRKIKTPDAIIAATAIAHDFTLISNDKAFHNIELLKYLDHQAL